VKSAYKVIMPSPRSNTPG